MKNLLTLAIFMFLAITSLHAQNSNTGLSGSLFDSKTKTPIEQAAIQLLSLPDSSFVTGTSSARTGFFSIPKIKVGKYILKISYLGYKTVVKPVQIASAKTPVGLGKIYVSPDAVLLNEAVVTAEAPQVVVVQDTLVYNSSAYRVPEGSMLEDLVKKLPGAEVDSDGKITINGKEIKKIMVDGKEFFSNDPKVASKNLPVNMIENIKAYDKKSDLARVTGIDDGEEEAVLDLTVKKGMKQGWFGNFIGGVGSKDRYEAGLMANRFTDNNQFSVIGSANNTNNQGFSEFGDAGQGLSGNAGSGINSSKSLGVNFAKSTKNLELGGNVSYGKSDRDSKVNNTTETFLQNGSSYSTGSNNNRRFRDDLKADFRLEWKPDSLTNIIFRPSVGYSNTDSYSDGLTQTFDNSYNPVNKKVSGSSSFSNNLTTSGNLQINRRLNSKGRNITLRATYGYNDGNTDRYSNSNTEYFNFDNDSVQKIDQYTDNESNGYNYRLQTTYTEPILNNRFLQFSYSYQYTLSRSEKYTYNALDNNMSANDFDRSYYSQVPDTAYSNCYENKYTTQEFNLSLRTVRDKYNYNFGISLEPQKSTSITYVGDYTKSSLSRNVLNYSPTFDYRYRFSKQSQLRMMYRGRSSQPDINDMQPIRDITDPLNIKEGNPALNPSYSNSFMLFYNNYMQKSQRGLMTNLSFNNTINDITNRVSYNEETGGKITKPVNVNGNWNVRGFLSFNTPLKNKKITLATYTNASYADMVGYTTSAQETVKNTTHNLNLYERLNGNYRGDIVEFGLSGSLRYGSSKNTFSTQSNKETFDYQFGANTNITFPWSVYLSSDLNYNIKTGYSSGYDKNEVIWNAQLSKNFLKNNSATIRLKIYDILQQQSNISRTISANSTQDTQFNTLNSYFMVHFVYRLNTFGRGKGGNRRGMENGPRPERGGNRPERGGDRPRGGGPMMM